MSKVSSQPQLLRTRPSQRRRHAVACLYVGLCVAHGGPMLFTVFFTVVCAVVHEDALQATITLGSIKVTADRVICLIVIVISSCNVNVNL